MANGLRETYAERLNRALDHLERNLDEDPSLEELARVACFSPFHFHRIFTGMVGEPLRAHVRRLRLERARHRLQFTSLSVTRVALDAGYDSPEAFSRAFRAQFGMAPSHWRDTARTGATTTPGGRSRDTGGRSMDVAVKTLPEMTVAYVRHTGPYMECGAAWERLCAWAGPKGLLGPGTRFLGLSHDDPEITAPERVRYDACITVPRETGPEGEVGVKAIGGGQYAVTLHKGPYEKMHETYARLCGGWGPESGREFGPQASVEFYLNDPSSTAPEELLTEIWVALLEG
ncbi:AraC family transcriptional regulator [Desulfocurvus sp.]|uniref:AraC family transcriptional regulator n=1 Tax=Desulfocurvus sp. TaxID=2871698 RepID=UPI0025BA2C96|nr:AraC family transcriptional regulator [Desulfocurvus sp.]MCK9239519.1 AraC family transcriptional regulator [Desulfocurvus sp.]